jgi:hypothetical protein
VDTLMDRRLGIMLPGLLSTDGQQTFPWLGSTGRALTFCTLSRCMLHYFALCRPPKRLWGVSGLGKGGKVERWAWGKGEGGGVKWDISYGKPQRIRIVALDDRVDTGDSAMTRSWEVYTNAHS